MHRLKERARYYEYERLGAGEMTTDEFIMPLEGMHDPAFKHKLLETLQSVNLTVETRIEFVQQLELIKKYNQQSNEGEAQSTNTKFYTNTMVNGISGKKVIAQPLVRQVSFAKEKITPRRCLDKKKLE